MTKNKNCEKWEYLHNVSFSDKGNVYKKLSFSLTIENNFQNNKNFQCQCYQ
jgi:hypothetical protein